MDPRRLDSPFYRVTSRAVILTPERKLVLVKDGNGDYQLPGGGWEHNETFEDCITREVQEELGVAVAAVSPVRFAYRQLDKRGYVSLRLAAHVTPESYNFTAGDGMVAVRLVTQAEFLVIKLCPGEGPVQDFVTDIWGGEA